MCAEMNFRKTEKKAPGLPDEPQDQFHPAFQKACLQRLMMKQYPVLRKNLHQSWEDR